MQATDDPVRRGGFTVIEALIVLVILGIVAVLAVDSFRGFGEKYRVEGETKQLYADLMDARGRAMQRSRAFFVRFILLSVFVLGALTYGVVVHFLDPQLHRRFFQDSLSQLVGRDLTVGEARVNLWRGGIAFRDLRIKDRSLDFDLLQSKRVILEVKVLPLFIGEIRWRRIVFENPVLRLRRDKDGRFNFFDEPGEEVEVKETRRRALESLSSLFGGTIVFEDGEIVYTDEGLEGPPVHGRNQGLPSWIGSYSGLYSVKLKNYDEEEIFIEKHLLDSENIQSENSTNIHRQHSVRTIFVGSDNTVWAGTYGSGLIRFNPSTGRINFYNSSSKVGSISEDYHVALLEDMHGVLWIGTSSSGLNKFNRSSERFKSLVIPDPDGNEKSGISSLVEDRLGNLWVGTLSGNIIKISNPSSDKQSEFIQEARVKKKPATARSGPAESSERKSSYHRSP